MLHEEIMKKLCKHKITFTRHITENKFPLTNYNSKTIHCWVSTFYQIINYIIWKSIYQDLFSLFVIFYSISVRFFVFREKKKKTNAFIRN